MPKLYDPFVIIPKRGATVTIRRGDKLGGVARCIAGSLPITLDEAREAAAFYFALGARLEAKKLGGPWKASELSANPKRRYLMR